MTAQPMTVWLVEDNPGDARLIREFIFDAQPAAIVNLEHFSSLRELAERAPEESCDLILLDLHLGESEGLDTLTLCAEIQPDRPIIVLTGMESESLGLSAVRSGAQDYLIKDEINATLLVRSITYAVERVRLSDHLRRARDERHVLDSAIAQLGQGMVLANARIPEMPITFANEAFLSMTGYQLGEVIGRNCRFLQGPETDAATVKQIRKALANHQDISVEILNYRKDSSAFWNRLFISPVFSQDGVLTHFVGLQTDITNQRNQAERLWLLEAAIEQANESVIISTGLDQRGKPEIVYANRAFYTLSGYEPEQIGGREGILLEGPDSDPVTTNQINRAIRKREPFRGETIGYRRSGDAFHMEISISPVRDTTGTVRHHVATQADITLRKRYEQQLTHDALHDSLTGQPNRVMFYERITQSLTHARRHPDYDFAVMMIDLDQFKIINESLGHSAGDQLIIELGKRIAGIVESTDTVARLGGDDFGILVEDIHSPYDAARIARRIHRAVQEPLTVHDQRINVSSSIGIVINSARYDGAEEIIRDADTAMYRAKDRGRAQYEIFDSELHLVAVNRLTLEGELRRAIEKQEFRVYYQPIVEISSGRFAAGEALIRWQHPTLGLVGPGYFLDVAIEANLIQEIGEFVLEEAISTAADWGRIANEFEYQRPSVTVNLDEDELNSATLVNRVSCLLDQHNVNPHSLVVEVTERALTHNNPVPIATIQQLSELGVRIAIDDFGVGYSTFAILQQLPVDFLKLDRSIMNPASDRRYSEAILRSISSLTNELGIRTVAEGIETPHQLELARSVEVSFAQGFYLGFPEPIDEVTQKFRDLAKASAR